MLFLSFLILQEQANPDLNAKHHLIVRNYLITHLTVTNDCQRGNLSNMLASQVESGNSVCASTFSFLEKKP